MSDNSQNVPFLGSAHALQLSLPVVSNVTPLAGSVYSFTTVYSPAVSSAWLLPSASSSSLQPFVPGAYVYQHAGTTMLAALPDRSRISTSAVSYPGVFEWDLRGSTDRRLAARGDITMAITDQDTTGSSMSGTAQCDQVSHRNATVPLYPALSASLVQGTAPQRTSQGHNQSFSYQEGSQLYYYHHNTLRPLLAGELRPCLQSYGSVSYTGSRASAPQPELVMVLQEIQPPEVQAPTCTSASYHQTSAPVTAETSFQVMETPIEVETCLGKQAPSQTLCLPQSPELHESCPHFSELNAPTDLGDTSITAQLYSPSELLALPPAPILKQTENKYLDEIKPELSKPLDAYEISIENQDYSSLPLANPNIQQPLPCFDSETQMQKPVSHNVSFGKDILGLKDQGILENGAESSIDFADITTIVADIHLPQLLNSLTDLDQFQDPIGNNAKDSSIIQVNQAQEASTILTSPIDQHRKNKNTASELLDGAPRAKVQCQDSTCMVEREGAPESAGASERPPEKKAKHANDTAQKAASSSNNRAKGHGQEKTKMSRENTTKKTKERKQARTKVKTEEKPAIPKMKRKRNAPELSKDCFKKPRTHLGMHMLESVQVFHALGKKTEKKTGLSSSRAVGNSGSTTEVRPRPAITSQLDIHHEGQGPEKGQGTAQNPEGTAERECPSQSQEQLPPPGRVKLVPLPFPPLDKPQVRNVCRRPLSLASRKSAAPYPARPNSNSAQPPRVNPSQPAPASTSVVGPAKPPLTVPTSATRPGVMNPTQASTIPRSAAPRPAPHRISSCLSLQKEPVPAPMMKTQLPQRPQSQYLLEDFSRQPVPWRKADIAGPVVSQPITEAQRPEREAMKRQAQLERENAAKYTALGKLQFFRQREKDMEISLYYGYAM